MVLNSCHEQSWRTHGSASLILEHLNSYKKDLLRVIASRFKEWHRHNWAYENNYREHLLADPDIKQVTIVSKSPLTLEQSSYIRVLSIYILVPAKHLLTILQ